jgi:hypothetical protein
MTTMTISLSPMERRERVALAANHAKLNRVLARELGVDESTIRRDRKYLRTPGDQRTINKRRPKKIKRLTREQSLKQMLEVSTGWIVDQGFLRDEVIYGLLPDAKKWLDLNRGAFPEYPLRPAALLIKTRPPNFKEDYGPAGMQEMFAACTDWFKSWLAHCAPLDASLREEVVNTLIDWAKSTLPLPDGMRRWGSERVHTFYQLPRWRP